MHVDGLAQGDPGDDVSSHDQPSRVTTLRRMTVRAYLGDDNYLVNTGDGTPQLARGHSSVYARGDSVLGRWSSTAGSYVLR
jgi:hypothetical protein